MKKAETLVRVHTHTHTHTDYNLIDNKVSLKTLGFIEVEEER